MRDGELLAEPLILLLLEKGHLAFVILFPAKEAVATQSFARDALDLRHFEDRRGARGLPVVAVEVVLRRDVEVAKGHVGRWSGGVMEY